MSQGSSPAERGLTLIEIIIVLVLMGAVIGLALPLVGNLDSIRGAAAGRRIVSLFNDARIRAVNSARPVEVVYDFEARSFAQRWQGGKDEIKRWQLPAGVRVGRIETGGESLEAGSAAVTFFPLGDASGGTIHISGPGERSQKVTVGILFANPVLSKGD